MISAYTTAPVAYDGFSAKSTEIGELRKNGISWETLRRVEIHEEHLEWQKNRYWSGLWGFYTDFAKLLLSFPINLSRGTTAELDAYGKLHELREDEAEKRGCPISQVGPF